MIIAYGSDKVNIKISSAACVTGALRVICLSFIFTKEHLISITDNLRYILIKIMKSLRRT